MATGNSTTPTNRKREKIACSKGIGHIYITQQRDRFLWKIYHNDNAGWIQDHGIYPYEEARKIGHQLVGILACQKLQRARRELRAAFEILISAEQEDYIPQVDRQREVSQLARMIRELSADIAKITGRTQ